MERECATKARARRRLWRALEMLEVVRIPSAKRRLEAYPHGMSGGMRQRAMIALALACKPKIALRCIEQLPPTMCRLRLAGSPDAF
jgi:ABC-type dipeptide/oligopeptide/nickel transport system ATPase component